MANHHTLGQMVPYIRIHALQVPATFSSLVYKCINPDSQTKQQFSYSLSWGDVCTINTNRIMHNMQKNPTALALHRTLDIGHNSVAVLQ